MASFISPPKASPGDRVAVLSPSFAAPGAFPAVHEQAMQRLATLTGLVPVEYPTTRQLSASPEARAADLHAAFADPSIRAIVATVGGTDEVRVIRHLDPALALADPKPFLGYSDNTHLHNWLWQHGIQSFYGGSTQVHLGTGPEVDAEHLRSLRAALLTGETLEVTDPGVAEDFGVDWADPRALHMFGERELTEPWSWAGPSRSVTGRVWGGCFDALSLVAFAGRLPDVSALEGAILVLETSEELPPAAWVRYWLQSLGELGVLAVVAGVCVARPPAVALGGVQRDAAERRAWRDAQRDEVLAECARYNPDAVVCVGVPFGHTRPQWIVPYGGMLTLDGASQTVHASYA